MNGSVAFQTIGLLPDDIIEEAFDLLDGGDLPATTYQAPRGMRKFINSGWGVAAVCAAVSFAILTGIVWAGRHTPQWPYPPTGESGISESETDSEAAETPLPETEVPAESATEAATEGILYDPITENGMTFVSGGDGTCSIEVADRNLTGAIVIPERSPFDDLVTGIASYAFRDCTGITAIVIPDHVASIGSGAFRGCSGLVSVIMPKMLTSMGTAVFQQCTKLKSITVPAGLETLPRQTFETCTELESVEFLNGLVKIGDNAFNGCSRLKILHVPQSLQSVGNSAFLNCCGLQTVYFSGTREEWNDVKIHPIGNDHLKGTPVVALG